ncbi:MAG: HAD family phosphatase [Clostridia bacterium]|nr:HAD family phosphatase [Clostridia bacterium]
MYKLVAIDLDGTLLNSYGEVSQRTREAIKEATQKGVEVVLASGRPISSVEDLATELEANHYLVSGNGATVYDMRQKSIVYDQFLSKEQILNIVKICEENSIYYNIYTENEVLTKSLNYNTLFYHSENTHKQEEKRTNINILTDVYDYVLRTNNQKYLKVTVCDQSQIVFGSIIKKLRTINDIDVLDVAHMSKKIIKSGTEEILVEYCYTEITNKNVNKWTALEYIMKKENISKEEVIAIGDNVNDKEMIEEAGLGVAMGNSTQNIKEIANEITSTNNEDGVYEIFRKYILI